MQEILEEMLDDESEMAGMCLTRAELARQDSAAHLGSPVGSGGEGWAEGQRRGGCSAEPAGSGKCEEVGGAGSERSAALRCAALHGAKGQPSCMLPANLHSRSLPALSHGRSKSRRHAAWPEHERVCRRHSLAAWGTALLPWVRNTRWTCPPAFN